MRPMYKKWIIPLIVLSFIIWYIKYPIFEKVTDKEYNQLLNHIQVESSAEKWIELKYTVSTGVSWSVKSSSDKSIDGYAILKNFVDPRFLSENQDFKIDLKSTIIVSSNNVRKINYHGEDVWLIDADKIYIHISDDRDFKKTYTMIDMSFVGVAKSVLGLFYRPLHYSL